MLQTNVNGTIFNVVSEEGFQAEVVTPFWLVVSRKRFRQNLTEKFYNNIALFILKAPT